MKACEPHDLRNQNLVYSAYTLFCWGLVAKVYCILLFMGHLGLRNVPFLISMHCKFFLVRELHSCMLESEWFRIQIHDHAPKGTQPCHEHLRGCLMHVAWVFHSFVHCVASIFASLCSFIATRNPRPLNTGQKALPQSTRTVLLNSGTLNL